MFQADTEVIAALLEDVLDARLIEEAVDEAVMLLQGGAPNSLAGIDAELGRLARESDRLANAIAAGANSQDYCRRFRPAKRGGQS